MPIERKRVVAHRPDAPDDAAKPQLSKEEIQALLTVVHPPSPTSVWSSIARRGGIAFLVTAILSFMLDSFLGWWWSLPIMATLAIAWAARPLWRQQREGWTR